MSLLSTVSQCAVRHPLLGGLLEQAQRAPATVAVRSGTSEVTYGRLVEIAARRARALQGQGIGDGDIVAFAAERNPQTIATMLAILACGAAYLPLDAAQPDQRLAAIIDEARPRLLLGDEVLLWRLPGTGPWIDRDVAAPSDGHLDVKTAGRLAYVLFTSGSTGRPNGIAMRTRAVALLLDWHRDHARLGRAARTLQFAPLGFDVSFQEIFSTLAVGGTLILPSAAERLDPWAMLALLTRERVERLFLPFVALSALAEAALDRPDATPATLTDVITAGEQLRITPALRAFFRALPGCVLHNHYGPTETHVATAYELGGDPATWVELPPIGTPLPHVRLRIDAASQGLSKAPGEGELLLGGDCLADGYVGRPDLTVARFVTIGGERWYRSGDRVRRNGADQFEYLGRLDDQIKIAGQRVEPAEIEAVLCRHPRVAQAVVIAETGNTGTRLVAHVIERTAAGTEPGMVEVLRRHCGEFLPEVLCPQKFVLRSQFPTTHSGKIDRHALAQANDEHAFPWDDSEPLRTQLLKLWQYLLDVAHLDDSANLFEAGARSLTVVHALTELRRHGHVLSVAQLYEHATVAAQVRLLAVAGSASAAATDERGAHQRTAFARFARVGVAP